MEDKPRRLQFDGDSTLPFQLHIVQELLTHFPLGNQACLFNDPVCQSRFPVIDMCDDTEVSNVFLIIFHVCLSCDFFLFIATQKSRALILHDFFDCVIRIFYWKPRCFSIIFPYASLNFRPVW